MNDWRMAWRLARRELRGGFAGFRIFLMCLILGIAAIAGIGSVTAAFLEGLRAEGQAILGGDVALRLVQRRAETPARDWLKAAGTLSESAALRTMLRGKSDTSQLVAAKAVDAQYPLYGEVRTDPPVALPDALAVRNGVHGGIADAAIFERLGVEIGDRVRLGDTDVELRARLTYEPDRNGDGLVLAPRLLVSLAALRASGLEREGSLIDFHYRLRFPDATGFAADGGAVAGFIDETRRRFPEAGWRIRDRRDAAPSTRRFIERVGVFATLIGLTALVVGGIGVGNAITAYLDQRRHTIATMRCLGATSGFVARLYGLEIAAISTLALALGLTLGAGLPWGLEAALGGVLPVPIVAGLYPVPLLAATGFGIVSAIAFTLHPLARAAQIPAAGLFRDWLEGVRPPPLAWRARLAVGAAFAGLPLLALAISGSLDVALWFVLGTGASCLVLWGAGRAVVAWAGSRKSAGRWAQWRIARANLARPGAKLPALVVSIGLAATLLSAVAVVDGNITAQIAGELPERAPAYFALDIRPDEGAAFAGLAETHADVSAIELTPILRGRITAINAAAAETLKVAPEAAWVLRGDRVLTYAAAPPSYAEIVAGDWWPPDYRGPPLLSFAAEIAAELGIGIGDKVTVNILGLSLIHI